MKKAGIVCFVCFSFILMSLNGCSKTNPGGPSSHSCSYAFGNNADNDTLNWGSGYIFACPFTISSGVTVTKLNVKLSGGPIIIYAAGIYSDNSGVPADLISQTGVINGAPGWNSVTITAAALNSGNTYWLVVTSENPGIRYLSGSGSCLYALTTWNDAGLPSDLASISWSPLADEIKIYAVSCK